MDGAAGVALEHRGVSRRELEVLAALCDGLTNAEIAARLGVSDRTVESHVSALLRKFEARDRRGLAGMAKVLGLPGPLLALPRRLELVAGAGRCVGRANELARLRDCWAASSSRTTVVLVTGQAGIGKSRLAAAAAAEVHSLGGRVLFGACSSGPHRPYEPFVDALQDVIESVSGGPGAERLDVHRRALSRLFPALSTAATRRTDPLDEDRERAEVVAGLHACLAAVAAGGRLLVVVEDVQWASSGTRDALAHIAWRSGTAPLMVVATAREGDPEGGGDVDGLIGRLSALPAVEVMTLGGLGVEAAAEVIADVGGALDVATAVRETGGNPLFLRELAREGPSSRSLRELVGRRFVRLDPEDLEVVDVAAVVGEQIDAVFIGRVLGRTAHDVLDALERMEAAGLVGPGSTHGRFAFTHEVFRSVRYHALGASRTMRLHAAVARALDAAPSLERLAELARHACLAGPRFDPFIAARLAQQAGDAAAAATDHGQAIDHYRRSLDARDLAGDDDPTTRAETRFRLGRSLVLVGDPDGLEVLGQAAEDALLRGQPAAAADAFCAMTRVPGGTITFDQTAEWVETLGTRILQHLGASEPAWTVRVMAILGSSLRLTGAEAQGTEMIHQAVHAARQLGEPVTLGRALLSLGFCGGPLDTDQRVACGHELLKLGERTGQEVFILTACQQLSWGYRELGDVDEMVRWHEASAARAHESDLEHLVNEAGIAALAGELDRATTVIDTLDAFARESPVGAAYVPPFRRAIADARGHLPDTRRLQHAIDHAGLYRATYQALLARTFARSGQPGRARRLLERARDVGFEPRYAPNGSTQAGSCWAEAAAVCADATSATMIGAWFEPLAGRFVDNGVAVWDTIDRVRALTRLTVGEPSGALAIVVDAVTASRQRRTPILLGRELVVLAAAQRTTGTDDGTKAIAEARAIAERTGAHIIDDDIRLFLEASPRPTDRLGLTSRERDILLRVQAGDTNSQIGRTLGISPATVRKHLEHTYAKLGVSTRTAAVARARDALTAHSQAQPQ